MVYGISKRAKGCLIQLSHSRTTVLTLNYIYSGSSFKFNLLENKYLFKMPFFFSIEITFTQNSQNL